ncbi:MAG TPA: diaminopimelate epimerase [Acidobacteriaceae bacterium]|nr:diaminopimelate epimerase [Acidobacteriaceae bacterium]
MTGFTKAHACGNDFLIVEGEADAALAVRLCARNTGVGADGVEFVEWTGERSAAIRLVNADGSVAEISGNGTRCVAAWMARRKGLKAGDTVLIETDAGPRECRVVKADGNRFEFAQGMGVPAIADKVVKLAGGTEVAGVAVSTGNPHFVIFVDRAEFEKHGRGWQELGREMCFHPDFPEQTNVEFVRVLDTNSIEIRIFERGVGPTTSSGTGTCATAAASIARRKLSAHLCVKAPGGEQIVDWGGEGAEILLTGPAELIASGEAW